MVQTVQQTTGIPQMPLGFRWSMTLLCRSGGSTGCSSPYTAHFLVRPWIQILRQIMENFIIFYVIWCTTDPEVDYRLFFALGVRTLFHRPLYLVVTCLSYLPVEYRFFPFREVTPGIVSVFSAELGSTLDTCCLVLCDVVWVVKVSLPMALTILRWTALCR